MQTYETIFVTSPTLTEEDERAMVDTLSAIVTDGGGTMVANDRMGRRRLAYPIEKHVDGVYVRFLYDSESSVPRELERRFGLSDKVLRALTVKLHEKWAEAAKVQAVADAKARVEAAEREALEREQAEKEALEREAAGESADEGAGSAGSAPAASAPETPGDAAPAKPPSEETS